MDLKGLLADQMGYFTPYDIPGMLLGMLLAALIAFALGLLARAPEGTSARGLAAMAAVTALAVSLVRASVPLSIALVAVALLLRGDVRESGWKPLTMRLAALTVGVGCGSSAGMIVLALFIPLGLLLRWSFSVKGIDKRMRRSDLTALCGLAGAVIVAFVVMAFVNPRPGPSIRDAGLPVPEITSGQIAAADGHTAHYTLDGSLPDARSPKWDRMKELQPGNVRIDDLITTPTSIQWRHPHGDFPQALSVRACLCDPHGRCGPVVTRTFLPDSAFAAGAAPRFAEGFAKAQSAKEAAVPDLDVISIVLPPGALFDPDTGIYVVGHGFFHDSEPAVQQYPKDQKWWKFPGNFQFRGQQWERTAHVEVLARDGRIRYAGDAAVRINGNNTRGFPQHALRLSFAEPMRDLHGRGHRSVVLRASGNDGPRAFMRDAVQHRLCAGLPFATSDAEPVVVFINGAYWGIHEIRERMDEDEIALRFGLKKKDFTIIEDRGVLDHGDARQIDLFHALLEKMERMDPVALGFADSLARQVDLENFLSYMAAQIILGNTDWPDHNVKYWRYTGAPDTAGAKDGRWRFIMGDSDMGLGYNTGADVDLFAHLATKQGPVARLFAVAMRNAPLRDRFRAILLELLDGPLSAASMTREVTAWRDQLAPEMETHIRRWRRPRSMEEWERNVDEVMTFATHRGDAVRGQLDRHLPALRPAP